MRPRTTARRLLMMSVPGAVLIGSLSILPGHAQTSDRHNPVRAAYMRAHFHQALLVHDAVARGDLARARAEATVLADISPTVQMPPGAEAFKRDNPNAQVQFFDTGHFALETHAREIADSIRAFLT